MNIKLQAFSGCRIHISRFFHGGNVTSTRASPIIDSIIRVDHAGELGADRIYAGQMAILGNSKMGPIIQHMWDQEKVHKETFEKLIVKYRARPTIMVPVWNIAGFLLGAGTALMGEKAAMACTVAVESVIVEHYNDQLRTLMTEPEKNKELLETIQKFRDDEQEHHDSGLDHGAEQAPFYKGLTEVIKLGCKTAIAISKDLFSSRKSFHLSIRSYSTSLNVDKVEEQKLNWDLYCAVCLERKPLIKKELSSIETRYLDFLADLEVEKSFKSDHEIRGEEDIKRREKLKMKADLSQADLDSLTKQTAEEFEDACKEELKAFQVASRITEADKRNDFKSLERKLDRNLYLLVREKNNWYFPKRMLATGETLRMTAERILLETCGSLFKSVVMGNAPYGFYKYNYPKRLNANNKGAKIFFYKAIYHSGQINLDKSSVVDYRWATYPELLDLIDDKKYLRRVRQFLIDDGDWLDCIRKSAET